MKIRTKKRFKYFAITTLFVALVLNIKITMDDPFLLMSEAVVAQTTSSTDPNSTVSSGTITTVLEDNTDESGASTLRKGSCWCDGKESCRKKKDGTVCPDRLRCSASGCIAIISSLGTIIQILSTF